MPTRNHLPKGRLLLIGGHEQRQVPNPDEAPEEAPDFILQRFVDELAAKNTVVVIPTASEEPAAAAEDYVELFATLGVKHVQVLDVQTREQANSPAALALLDRANGVMFTGGDQLRLTALLGGTQFLQRLRERYHKEHFVIAGTSAGAAAMSTAMIYQGRNDAGFRKDEIHLSAGLQLLPDVAIDTHFVTRGRIVRMAQIIAGNPGCLGIGLEEDTAVLVTDGRELEVLGNGVVVLVDGLDCTGNTLPQVKPGEVFSIRDLKVHLLSRGERYSLPQYQHAAALAH
ncbi:cyanophycinase [Hymenobacter sedentarius]|uniref:Cyanophycinase n=1 Tax=Hymenobacter sedentarius TaxID=1411621 RepID=A0A0U4BB24_9BACT|nr:cyanophycinase [Hymenobacter sedentarius]ALW83787.1 cyanophycinase [Hymenobacter sedentarius]